MNSAKVLQDFVRDRLTAAAEEISKVFGQTVLEYERELERLRRLLELRSPGKQTPNTELPQACDGEAEVERALISQDSAVAESPDPTGPEHLEPQSSGSEMSKRKRGRPKKKVNDSPAKKSPPENKPPGRKSPRVNSSPAKKSPRETQTELPQPPVVKEENISDQEMDSHQEDLPPVETEETDTSMPSPSKEGSVDSEQQPISPSSPLDESQDQTDEEEMKKESKSSRKSSSDDEKGEESPAAKKPDKGRAGKKSFECDFCGKSYLYMNKLDLHLKAHTGEDQYSCETCGEVFSQRSSLKEHLKSHLRCDTCGKDFKYKCMLVKHQRIHTHEKPFSCEVCEKKFRNKPAMETHKKRHIGERRYVCHCCKRRFEHSEELLEHMKSHPGEPHICKVCGLGFGSLSLFHGHQKVHNKEKPHTCTLCGKSFERRYCLVVHTRTHTGDKPYACDFCGQRFYRASMLNKHGKTHEEENEEEVPDWLEATPQV